MIKKSTFNVFKKNITSAELAKALLQLIMNDASKDELKDVDENILLDERDKAIVLMSHIFDLFEVNNLEYIDKLDLITILVMNKCKISNEDDWIVEIAVVADTIKKLKYYFQNAPLETDNFTKQPFPLDKNFNPIQKMLVLERCITNFKSIDSVFQSMKKTFSIIDKKQ